MKKTFLVFVFLLQFQISFCQTEKLVHGTVLNNDFPVQGIKVINLVTEKTTVTNNNGSFSILAKPEDMLVFISIEYNYKRKFIELEDFNNPNLIIKIEKKPLELKDVLVTKKPIMPIPTNTQAIVDRPYFDDLQSSPKIFTNPPNGTIENGINFIRIFTEIGKLLIRKKSNNNQQKIDFKEVASNKVNQSFFIKNLKLEQEQIVLFLEFCDADPKSKTILENYNELKIMDFLITKSIEFKALLN